MAHAIVTSFIPVIDANGVPISGAKVNVYDAGTTTPKAIYSDSALSIAAANPVITNARGMHAIRYVAAGTYKIATTESDGTAISDYSWDNIDTGVAVGSGALAVASGGTGASSASAARTSLGAASSTEVSDIATDVAVLQDELTGVDATQLATGTTAQRPISPAEGQARANTTTTKFEGYINSAWDNFMLEAGNATSTSAVTAETAEATYIRPDRLKHSQRVAIAWAYVTISGGTPTLANGFNISSSITDNGTGDFTFSFSEAQPNANFAIVGSTVDNNIFGIVTRTTTTLQVRIRDNSASLVDPANFGFVVFGDYA